MISTKAEPRVNPTLGQIAEEKVIEWLLGGDPAIEWQTLRDLTKVKKAKIEAARKQVATKGWGKKLLDHQDNGGTWAGKLYSPKWISTTYTMMLLRDLGLEASNPQAQVGCARLLDGGFYKDGGINYSPKTLHCSELCITGMVLSILSHFHYPDERVKSLADHLLREQMKDGGWNCLKYRGATHSSFHTTISVLEGLRNFAAFSPHRAKEVRVAQERGREFLLIHRLFRSDHTGNVVDSRMTRFHFPPRWHYDILRALDYFQSVGAPFDERMNDALEIVIQRQKADGRWLLQAGYPGRTFFELEKAGQPSRWNTLRALRVLKQYSKQI